MKIKLHAFVSRTTFILFFSCILKISNAQAPCDSIVYPCRGTVSETGFFFDLVAGANNVLVESISTMSQNGGTRDVEMYYKLGTTNGFESNSIPWFLIGAASNFTPLSGLNCPIPMTHVPIPINVCIPAGQRYGFYLALLTGTGTFEMHDSLTEGDTATTDGILTLFAGKGAFSTGAFTPFIADNKTFQGSIQYSCGCTIGIESNNFVDGIRVFPVPAQNELNLEINFTGNDEATVSVYNIYGVLVKQENLALKNGRNVLRSDISELPAGIFSVSISGRHLNATKFFTKF